MNSYANSVEVCEVCQKMVLVPKLQDPKTIAEAEMQRKKDLGAEIKEKFGIVPGDGKAKARKEGGEGQNEEEKKRERAEKAKAAIAEAKAKVAARNNAAGTGVAAEAGGPTSTTKTMASTPPKVKKASRVVSVMKLKKIAQGEDKVPLSSRIYVSIRSPTFPHLDDKAVYIDKTWTVGRSLDKILEWLKIVVPKNEPFDAQKRFSIFHAKDIGDIPVVLNMQDRLQQMAQVESGDIFYLAPADCTWPST
ncbi:hypothetical protein BGZ54_005739 [Gamsiella multidivaricata]|nr:hypothetical protein BGZ54_005739 [Gamsiella multidivaricata]